MAIIKLSNGFEAIVDDEDYEHLSQFKWHYCQHGYARKNGKMVNRVKGPSTAMHRLVTGAPKDKQVDHINGNRLDNRKHNLRLCTNAENTRNQKKYKGSSKYKGVCWYARDGLWHARIKVDYKTIHLGYFQNEEDAATAYNFAAIKHFGDFARLNEAV